MLYYCKSNPFGHQSDEENHKKTHPACDKSKPEHGKDHL